MSQYLFIEPTDILILRTNKLFGDSGSYGETQVLPWPSVMAGALRSALLARDDWDLQEFATGNEPEPHPHIGTPEKPGTFRLRALTLAQETDGAVAPIRPLPADLFVPRTDGDKQSRSVWRLHPRAPAAGIETSAPTPQLAVLRRDETSKPAQGLWLSEPAWGDYLAGKAPEAGDLIESAELWRTEERIGVALESERGATRDGALFTTQAVSFQHGTGYLAVVEGADLPDTGLLRLGGDARSARYRIIDPPKSNPDWAAIADTGRCRLVLTTPGLFDQGWLPTGMYRAGNGEYRFELHGVRARVASAAIPPAEVISGWDLAAGRPKPAERAAPTGSVYCLDELEANETSLRKLAGEGLWPESDYDAQRRAEGFNRVEIAAY